jgi:hypothetical protein
MPQFAFGQSVEFARRSRTEANPLTTRRQMDMMADGRIMGVLGQGIGANTATTEIVVVLNWFDEVRQRVPLP